MSHGGRSQGTVQVPAMADAPQFRTLSAHGGADFEAGRLGGPRGEQLEDVDVHDGREQVPGGGGSKYSASWWKAASGSCRACSCITAQHACRIDCRIAARCARPWVLLKKEE